MALSGGSPEEKSQWQWMKMKAMESCYGEENIKLFTVNTKKAIAKCHQQDAPELELPIYSQSNKFVNALLSHNVDDDEEEDEEELNKHLKFMEMMMKMMHGGHSEHHSDHHSSNHGDGNSNWMEKMKMKMMEMKMKKFFEKMFDDDMEAPSMYSRESMDSKGTSENMMMIKIMKSIMGEDMMSGSEKMNSYSKSSKPRMENNPKYEMFKQMFGQRTKREAEKTTDNLELGNRLVEKLMEQKRQMEQKVGNMTCVLQEMNVINSDNEIDVGAMKKHMEQYKMPSEWFSQRYTQIIDMCYEGTTNLPAKVEDNAVISGDFGSINLVEVKAFMKCCSNAKTKLCIHQDMKNKIEASFGPVESLLGETGLSEAQFFPLVFGLLHDDELFHYMFGK